MIDDVDYMRQHGEIETHMFYIDSNQRSNLSDPVNDFAIEFDEPIRNVVGIDVKDSTVPSTTYTIDSHNNVFRMFAMGFDAAATTYVINYANQYVEIFLNLMTEDAWRNEHDDAEAAVVVRDYRAGPLPDMSNMMSIEDAPFDHVHAITILGPDDVVPASIPVRQVGLSSAVGTYRVAYHADDGTGEAQKVFKRVFFFPIGNYSSPARIVTMAEQGDGPRTAFVADSEPFLVASSEPVDRLGTLDILTQPWAIALGALEASSTGTGTCVVAYDTTCAISHVIGFSETVNEIIAMGRKMSTNMSRGDSTPGSRIRTGNLINMSGDRYIMLRCPQVESSAYIGTGRNSQRGIGLFKLGSPGVIRSETADYVNVVKKRFHPIAKLDRLNFRFEREATGLLYNFRGIGTLMIIAIDVYVNKKPAMCQQSPLNPDYDIDYRAYQLAEMQRESLYEQEEQDMMPLTEERVTRAIGEHNALVNRF